MRLETFRARDLSSVARNAEAFFGDDAVVLQTRSVRENGDLAVEVVAASATEVDAFRALLTPAPLPVPGMRRGNRPYVIALVGPTGAGKTTTIAKLAANAALVEGKRVKLVTLDNFRVGGVDQIRTFADLIGLPLDVLEHADQLTTALDDSYDLVLIDTAGRSPRETAPIAELAEVLGTLPPVEVHIVIPAATSAPAIDQLVARYQSLGPTRLLFTKLDEVDSAPELTRAPARTGLPITWVTTGQAVPEDLEEPTRARLQEMAASAAIKRAA